MSIGLRIKELRKKEKLSQIEFSSKIGIDNSQFSKIEAGKLQPTIAHLLEICSIFNISSEWLLTGKGSMLREEKGAEPADHVVGTGKMVPLVSVTAVGGFGNADFRIDQQDIKAYYRIPKFDHKKVDFMIEVEGSSMYPKYNSGDVVACRIIQEDKFIQWNKTHVVATKDQGLLIKRIKESELSECLTMVSDNKDYSPFDVPKEEIEGIALVVGVVRLE